jgi:hypothetical protein
LYAESVDVGIVSGFVGCCHEINGVAGGTEEEELEGCVVGAVGEGPEDIEVAGGVYDEVESL